MKTTQTISRPQQLAQIERILREQAERPNLTPGAFDLDDPDDHLRHVFEQLNQADQARPGIKAL